MNDVFVVVQFYLSLNFISFCFNLMTIHKNTQQQKDMKFKLRINLIRTYIDSKWEIEEKNKTPLAKKTLP